MATLSKCLKTHQGRLEAAGVDIAELKARAAEIRETDGADAHLANISTVEELIDIAEGERQRLGDQVREQGGEIPELELAPTGAAAEPAPERPEPTTLDEWLGNETMRAGPDASDSHGELQRGDVVTHGRKRELVIISHFVQADGRTRALIRGDGYEAFRDADELTPVERGGVLPEWVPQSIRDSRSPVEVSTDETPPAERAPDEAAKEGGELEALKRQFRTATAQYHEAFRREEMMRVSQLFEELTRLENELVAAGATVKEIDAITAEASGQTDQSGRSDSQTPTHQRQPQTLKMTAGANWTPHVVDTFLGTVAQPRPRSERGKAIRREDILGPLGKALGVNIYQGRIPKQMRARGFYRVHGEEVRIRDRSDLEVTAHELAHFIDDRNPELRATWKRNRLLAAELKSVSYDTEKVYEGFAEFIRLWMTQPEKARGHAPNYHDYWEAWLDNHPDAKFARAIRAAKAGMLDWFEQAATNQLESKIGAQQRLNEAHVTLGNRFRQSVLDDLEGIRAFEATITGERAPALGGIYANARLTKAAFSIVDGAIRFGAPKAQFRAVDGYRQIESITYQGKSLEQLLKPVMHEIDDFITYAVAKSADELKRQGRENLFTRTEIAAGLALEKPEYVEVFRDYLKWNKAIVDFAQSMGIINREGRRRWQRQWYIPFYRVHDPVGAKFKSGIEGNVQAVHRLTGGTGNLKDILGNMVKNAELLITEGLRNEARQRIAAFAMSQRGGMQFIAKIPKATKPIGVTTEQIKERMYEAMGLPKAAANPDSLARAGLSEEEAAIADQIDLSLGAEGEYMQFWQFGQAPNQGDGQLMAVLHDGKPSYYEVADPILFRSIESLNRRHRGKVMQFLAKTRAFGQRTITLTPDFMAANLVRDTLHGWVFSEHGFTPVVDSIAAMKSRATKDETWQSFLANGGGMSSYYLDDDAMRAHIDSFYTNHGINPHGVMNTTKRLWYGVNEIADAFEVATRIGEYQRALGAGATPREAAYSAREISTDFAMRGDSEVIGWFYDIIIFLKAAMNGLDRAYRGFTQDRNRAEIVVKSGLLAVVSAALYALNRGNPLYDELEDWDKDAHWHFFIPVAETGEPWRDYYHLRLPKIWEVGAIASVAERAAGLFMDSRAGKADVTAFGRHLSRVLTDQLKFEYIPYIVAGPVETYALNRHRYTGRPIESQGMQSLIPALRESPYTSRTMAKLGAMTADLPRELQISPAKAEHLFRSYFNTFGMYGLAVADQITTDVAQPNKKWAAWPGIRRFFKGQRPGRIQAESDFWDALEESRELTRSFKVAAESGDNDLAETLVNKPLTAVNPGLERTFLEVRRLQEAQSALYQDASLTAEAKTEQLHALQHEKNQLLSETMAGVEEEVRDAKTQR